MAGERWPTDYVVERGRATGGQFVRVVHRPSGLMSRGRIIVAGRDARRIVRDLLNEVRSKVRTRRLP